MVAFYHLILWRLENIGVFWSILWYSDEQVPRMDCFITIIDPTQTPYRQVGYMEQASGYIFMSWLPINIPVCVG
jgi:hypothetical protein